MGTVRDRKDKLEATITRLTATITRLTSTIAQLTSTSERQTTTIKKDVDSRIPSQVSLRSAEAILSYKPIDVVRRISPRAFMVIGVDNDAVTPTDHALSLYEAAGSPKRFVMQRYTTHYAAYDRYWTVVTPMIVEWFERYLVSSDLDVRNEADGGEVQEFIEVPDGTG